MRTDAPTFRGDSGDSASPAPEARSGPQREPLPAASLGGSLRSSLRLIWDRLGAVLLLSLVGTAALIAALFAALTLARPIPIPWHTAGVAIFIVCWLSPLVAGAYHLSIRVAANRPVDARDLLVGIRRFAAVSVRLGLLHLFVGIGVGLNILFYSRMGGPVGVAATVACGYAVLFWAMMALYQGPLLVLQESGRLDDPDRSARRGALAVIRRSFYLAAGEPLFTLGLLGAVAAWSALTMLTAVGAAALWLGGLCILTARPTMVLLNRYSALPEASDEAAPAEED